MNNSQAGQNRRRGRERPECIRQCRGWGLFGCAERDRGHGVGHLDMRLDKIGKARGAASDGPPRGTARNWQHRTVREGAGTRRAAGNRKDGTRRAAPACEARALEALKLRKQLERRGPAVAVRPGQPSAGAVTRTQRRSMPRVAHTPSSCARRRRSAWTRMCPPRARLAAARRRRRARRHRRTRARTSGARVASPAGGACACPRR
mmetsp:Transcript_17455/g.54247  ORF Transcript_17455/g.54247 Transcript_17455/m.54247 type:complete len:205 (+) Transcript_17455:188-802(+)